MKKYVKGWIGKQQIYRETPKAYCLRATAEYGQYTQKWIPKSVIIIEAPNQYDNCEVYVASWFYDRECSERYGYDIQWTHEECWR